LNFFDHAQESSARGRIWSAMSEVTAGRTLVKSPPELWAVCSDADSLAQHLEAFGEIRITRLEPETTVAWEGERASGTVRIEPSGWGTKVTVTAAATEPVAAPAALAPATELEPAPEPVAAPEALAAATELAPAAEPAPAAERLDPEPKPARRPRFLARLFGAAHAPVSQPVSQPVVPEALISEPSPTPTAPEPTVPEPAVAPEPEPIQDQQAAVDPAAVLEAALDSLGQAHKRPFSR
jgi:hypothetical protein